MTSIPLVVSLPLDLTRPRSAFRLGHNQPLDGLRGISILLVLSVHLRLISSPSIFFLSGGFLGVDVFFVISGFLITSLLLTEHEKNGEIALSRFYARRALRLLPALITVLIFICLFALFVGSFAALGLTPLRFASTLAYFTNWVRAYEPPDVWILAHFWSLSIEEQFYLIWPVTLVLFFRFRVSRSTILLLVSSLISASALLKVYFYFQEVSTRRIVYGSDTRADVILIGCLLALALHWDRLPSFLYSEKTVSALSRASLIILATFVLVAGDGFRPLYFGGFTMVAFAVAIIILHLTCWPSSRLARVLKNPILLWLGKRSYGLYLWHWPMYEIAKRSPIKTLTVPVALLLTVLVAALSFRFVEKPFLKLKRRYSATKILVQA